MAPSTVDPITRIEGHLSLEKEVENCKVSEAWVSGNLYRGLEHALEGRSPMTPRSSPSASAACAL